MAVAGSFSCAWGVPSEASISVAALGVAGGCSVAVAA